MHRAADPDTVPFTRACLRIPPAVSTRHAPPGRWQQRPAGSTWGDFGPGDRLLTAGGCGEGGSCALALGIANFAASPIQGRGVLVDLAAHCSRERMLVVDFDRLQAILSADRVMVEPGDILPLHEHCLFKLGVPLGELWWLTPPAHRAALEAAGRRRLAGDAGGHGVSPGPHADARHPVDHPGPVVDRAHSLSAPAGHAA